MIVCNRCGKENQNHYKFCLGCGAELTIGTAEEAPVPLTTPKKVPAVTGKQPSAPLAPLARAQHEELLWGEDAAILDAHARTFPERMRVHNRNGLTLAERLRSHPNVERVWYPKWESCEAYEAVRKPDGGWGALITFLPARAEARVRH